MFSVSSVASVLKPIPACATKAATPPQHPASSCTNSHLLARLVPTCTGKNFCRKILRSRRREEADRRPVARHPNPTRNHNLNLSANLNTFSKQTTPIVVHCRRSRIRPKSYTPHLNGLRSAGLPTGKLRDIPASLRNLNTLTLTVAATPPRDHPRLLHRVAVCCTVLHRVAPKFFHTQLQHLSPVTGPASSAPRVKLSFQL